ncbi:MAG: hypothetical protein ACYCO5_08710 [Acidobacteriaceae bacterium]
MGYIEDTRKLMQDFLAPELRAIAARLDSVEALVEANERRAEERSKDAEARTQQRFTEVERRFTETERRSEQRHSETLNAIASLSNYQVVLERPARLESKQNVSAA